MLAGNSVPEAFESGADSHTLFTVLLVGFLGFYALQRVMLWRHSHGSPGEAGSHAHGLGRETALTIVVGDGVHNFVDGIMIAAAFLTDPALGWATAIAVIAHEIPQEAVKPWVRRLPGRHWRWRPGLRWLRCWRPHTAGDEQRSKLTAAPLTFASFFCAEMMPVAIFLICGSLPDFSSACAMSMAP